MQKQIKQVFHPIHEWEEMNHNMWGPPEDRAALDWAVAFTGNHKLYGSYMRRVCDEWPVSCENALTDPHMNRKAWLGHAACALANRVPEDIVRQAWSKLSDEQKYLANKEAERAIQLWEESYIKDKWLYEEVGGSLL